MALMKVTPTKLSKILVPLYAAGIQVPTVFQWGPPGVGKSEGVRTMAVELANVTGKTVYIHDVRLLLFNPVDLRGIPVPATRERLVSIEEYRKNPHGYDVLKENTTEITDYDRGNFVVVKDQFSKWLRPQIFDMDPSPNVINIMFLDELTAAPPTVQASAYQLTLDRKVGEHELADNVIIMGAGNRLIDKGVAYKMPTPLANRMTHFEIGVDADDWKEWAIPNGIHELVLGFINFQKQKLHVFDPRNDDPAFPTPRTWAFSSKYLDVYGKMTSNTNELFAQAYPMIAGTIGEGAAVEFQAFAKTFGSIPDIDAILRGEIIRLPSVKMDVVCALSAGIVARSHKAKEQELINIIRFCRDNSQGLPPEFGILTMKDMLKVQNVKEKMMATPEWVQWSKETKVYIH